MKPNPVCYNGLNLPNDAIHVGHVSLGIKPKDYRADTAQKWRAGISPEGAVVLYGNTYELNLSTEANAEPRIWWTLPAGTVNDFKLKITELLSRLPERAGQNYEVFATYDDAITWLHTSEGKYSLVNDDYPEYYLPGEYCIFNIETGLLSSYPASGQHFHNLANPNMTVGNQLNANALSWRGFEITNAAGDLNIDKIGAEPGITYSQTGHVISIDDLDSAAFSTNSHLVFESVVRLDYASGVTTILSLLDSSSGNEVLRIEWDTQTLKFSAHYPGLGSIIEFDSITTPWNGPVHIAISVPVTNDPSAINDTLLLVQGATYGVSQVTGTDFAWNNTVRFQIGNNRSLNTPVQRLYSAKAYIVDIAHINQVFYDIRNINYSVFTERYS